MHAEILQFFESYRRAFNELNPQAIARHFCVPSTMSTNDGYIVWADAGQVVSNMTALCEMYREGGFAEAHCELLEVVEQPPLHAFANVLWTVGRKGSLPPWRFRTSYNLRRESGEWRVLLCTAYEEQT